MLDSWRYPGHMSHTKSIPTSHPHETGQTDSASAPKETPARRSRLGRPQDVPSLALIKESTRRSYHGTYKEIFDPGALDRKTKELIAIAASAITGCQGCLMGHIRKARALGATMDEIKESVGVAFAVNAATVVDNTDVAAAMLNLAEEEPGEKNC